MIYGVDMNLGVMIVMNNSVLKLVSVIPQSVNHYLATRVVMKSGKPIPVVYETSDAKKYKKEFAGIIKKEVVSQNWELNENKNQHYYCDCIFYFDRKHKDTNNYFKLLLDAITESKCVWLDDETVCERVNAIYFDAKNPRIELTIYPVDYIGIFKDRDSFDSFEDKCKSCSRYSKNCSILKKALEGRIQEEISSEYKCSKFKEKKQKE